MEPSTYKITIEGTVQGVGFRPFVYTLAKRFGLTGSVCNGTQGVKIELNATLEMLEQFLQALQEELPPLASIDAIHTAECEALHCDDFQIVTTNQEGERTVRIPPDVSICAECEKELFDPVNRRYGYPFITCTHCGVRYSIIYDLPYDRKSTSMKFFKMCKACEAEYTDPLDRRYHAQPIGCWECGPTLKLGMRNEELGIEGKDAIDRAVELILEGNIVAVKGVGGYHLMCDATNETAVMKLRERKHRPAKPFAVMVRDIEMARGLAEISEQEEMLLLSKERPIVLLKSKIEESQVIHDSSQSDKSQITRPPLAANVAPKLSRIGLFLPYTPLHLLLFEKLKRPLVATSANLSDEPICTNIEELRKLQGVYDYVLEHNREIVNGCDDSVVMAVEGQEVILRRARGYAPASIKLPFSLPKQTLAMGANQKSTVAIGFENQVILSPHIGDLGSIGSVEYYEKNIETLKRIYAFTPEIIIHDKHPQYESTKVAKQLATRYPLPATHSIQHHHAHILGVMAEKQIEGKVFGVAFDGTGYGDDGNLWGGEFMVCGYDGYERVAHIAYFKLLGGEKAIKEPRRVALSLLFERFGEAALDLNVPSIQAFSKTELRTLYISWQKGLNTPLSSSVGRLFDAVASLLGICHVMSFEGESGMLLEEQYDASITGYYPFDYKEGKIDILPTVAAILEEEDVTVAVSKFFNTLVEMIATLYAPYDLPLVLSGGVFQNRVFLELIFRKFPDAIIPNTIPPNDGGIALGQIAASRFIE